MLESVAVLRRGPTNLFLEYRIARLEKGPIAVLRSDLESKLQGVGDIIEFVWEPENRG